MNTPLITIVGETASGKSAVALELAEHMNGEIICADSWTVRRGVNIGTAKPSMADRTRVPHHLIDIIDADELFTAAQFKRLAVQAINEISGRGKLPIMVGGTGLYIDSVIYDYSFLKQADSALRSQLNTLELDQLLARVRSEGLSSGAIDINNKRRVIRLIETKGEQPDRNEIRDNTLVLGLRVSRDVLKLRVISRVDDMMARGLEQEVRDIQSRYGWTCEALKGVGYAQWREFMNGHESPEQVRERIITATLNLAKRQRTWFKRNKSIHWLNTPVSMDEVVALTTTFIAKND